jgi:hypothetical protein
LYKPSNNPATINQQQVAMMRAALTTTAALTAR